MKVKSVSKKPQKKCYTVNDLTKHKRPEMVHDLVHQIGTPNRAS